MFLRIVIILFFISVLPACEKIALLKTNKKQPIASNTPLAKAAEKTFWDILHEGHYQSIPLVNTLLLAAYLQNPNDPKLASHIGFLHIWKITEREREQIASPNIVNEIILAKKYFGDAVALNPDDARVQGFLGDAMLAEGQIFGDEREQIRGYFQLKRAIAAWPQFNYFAAGYPMSTLPAHSERFKEGLEWQWKTMDICTGGKIDRNNPDFARYMKLETHEGPMRACWNSWIAPHNFEGFFLNMGDMLVKQGDVQTAVKIYNNAKLSKDYDKWPFRNLLEQRIKQANENKINFQKINHHQPDKTILFDSGYGCVICHQAR